MNHSPFWTDDFPEPAMGVIDDLPEKTDVLVVGAGLTGLNAPVSLRRAGIAVTVVAARRLRAGARHRNGGQVH